MLVHKYKILSAISTVMFYLPETFAGVIDALFGLNLQWTGFFTVTSRDASLRPQDAQPQQYLGCWERADTKFSVVHVSGVIYIWPWHSSGKTKVRSCFKIFCLMNPKNKKGDTFHVAHVLMVASCCYRHVLNELIDTEKTYVSQLADIVHVSSASGLHYIY